MRTTNFGRLLVILTSAGLTGACAKMKSVNAPDTPSASPAPITTSAPAPVSPPPSVPAGGNPVTDPRPPATVRPECPTTGDISLDPRKIVQRKTVWLDRRFTMIWQKNCEGRVISKKWTLMGTSTKPILIQPAGAAGAELILSAHNRSDCAPASGTFTSGSFTQSGGVDARGRLRLVVGLAGSGAPVEVLPDRENYIDYEFRACVQREGAACVRSQVVEQGTLILTVRVRDSRKGCVVRAAKGCSASAPRSFAMDAFPRH